MKPYTGVIDRYRRYLPVTKRTPVVTLREGETPLIYSAKLSGLLGKKFKVYLKYEGLNPTGSFKDRGMTLAISKAKEEGARAVICASTGNTSASAAAYAARGNLKCVVVIPEGAIVVIETDWKDTNKAGDRYAEAIAETLRPRCSVRRRQHA